MRELTKEILEAQQAHPPTARVKVRINSWSIFGGTPYTWEPLSTKLPATLNGINGAAAVACQLPGAEALRVFLPEDGSMHWQKVTAPTTAAGWTARLHTDTSYKMTTGAPALLPSAGGADLIWRDNGTLYRRPYLTASNSWGGRTSMQGQNGGPGQHVRAINTGSQIFVLTTTHITEYSTDYTYLGEAAIDEYYSDKGFIPTGIRYADNNLYCYFHNPNYDNPNGPDWYSVLIELKFSRASAGQLSFVDAERGFSGSRFIDYTGEGIGDWEETDAEPVNPKELTLNRATYGPGPNHPHLLALRGGRQRLLMHRRAGQHRPVPLGLRAATRLAPAPRQRPIRYTRGAAPRADRRALLPNRRRPGAYRTVPSVRSRRSSRRAHLLPVRAVHPRRHHRPAQQRHLHLRRQDRHPRRRQADGDDHGLVARIARRHPQTASSSSPTWRRSTRPR